jgi:hypothetical protein
VLIPLNNFITQNLSHLWKTLPACIIVYLCKKRIVLPITYERLQYSENANYFSVFCEDGLTQLKKNSQDCDVFL